MGRYFAVKTTGVGVVRRGGNAKVIIDRCDGLVF